MKSKIFLKKRIEDWLTVEKINANNLPEYYGKIYQKRFSLLPSLGFDFLNREMESREPSFGYTVLTQLLAETTHNVVITTNFDNLIEYSLYVYSGKQPLICGHEALAGYAKASLSRPLIIKIHRDLLLAPFNNDNEIAKLEEDWEEPLQKIFSDRVIVFLGYGGNDGSLMGFLSKLKGLNQIYWCSMKGSDLQPAVKDFLEKNNGIKAVIDGFDELMVQLHNSMELTSLKDKINAEAEKRVKVYDEKMLEITKAASDSKNPEQTEAIKELVEKNIKEESAWNYILNATIEEDINKQEVIYSSGIARFPNDGELNGSFAIFLHEIRKNYDEAEVYHLKAIELDSNNPTYNGNYAIFLKNIRKDYDKAEFFYKKALNLAPEEPVYNSGYAVLLSQIRKNNFEAERLYRKSLEVGFKNADCNCNYAGFLFAQGNREMGLKYLEKAFQNNPQENATLELYYYLYAHVRERMYEAKEKIEDLLSLGYKSVG